MLVPSRPQHLVRGAQYFVAGAKLLLRPELRRYLLVPLAVNLVLFGLLTYWLLNSFSELTALDWQLPAWLDFFEKIFKWVAWFLITAVLIIGYGYCFNLLTNLLAAPFYGFLAQRTEELLTGELLPDEPLVRMVPRTILRELHKLWYFLLRGTFVLLLMLLLATIPVLNLAAPVLGLLWGAWCMAIQYSDYPADNHQTPFRLLRKRLRRRRYSSLGLGGTVMVASMVPVLNIIAMPAAVTGGTLLWVHELRHLRRVVVEDES